MLSIRLCWATCAIFAVAGLCPAATPKEIDAAVQKATALVKAQYQGVTPQEAAGRGEGVGVAALSGLALLESGVAANDPALKLITAAVRDRSFTETQTYHIALCLIYLDRLGEKADEPIIQMLGVRLLAGQNARGGWTYNCVSSVPPADERALRAGLLVTELKAGGNDPPATKPPAGKPGTKQRPKVTGKLHPVVEKYAGRLASSSVRQVIDDNSNTQFGVLGVWVARKHGVPAEDALGLIEKRFLATQNASGGWPYAFIGEGSPSMTCAGLLGLATAIGRREERRLRGEANHKNPPQSAKPVPKQPAKPPAPKKGDDPFFNPPEPPKSEDPFFHPAKPPEDPPAKRKPEIKKKKGRSPADARDAAVQRALASLGRALTDGAPQGRGRARAGRILIGNGGLGNHDFYFLWSLERVGVIYGLDKIGGVDWYDVGAEELVRAQNPDGSWGDGARGSEVDTAFALLFLARSNLVRDLTTKVQRDASNTELRAGAGPAATSPPPTTTPENPEKPGGAAPARPAAVQPPPSTAPSPPAAKPAPADLPSPSTTTDEPKTIATGLVDAPDSGWEKQLAHVRDAKGAAYTQGLVLALHRLKDDRLKSARAALAERLTRMTAETLRSMVKEKDAELRRGAVLAMAMKDDKTHLPDLIAALLDDEDSVVMAAKAGLKSLTGQDFGPARGASLSDRTAVARAWLEWLRKQN